ncbi:maleylpyruvate isomerase family mycothiol-dependent enzyme [Kineococcus auxinigenes]|uniref:maleylpyruvate isomerase family mycothiol-dependent enzyme n=1 Tax=unclassified Kineococcus TaxID=2621656 RepID=UPI003D7C72EF
MTPARLPGPTTMSSVPPPLTTAQTTAAVADERVRLADWAAALTREQWQVPSLCEAWTVRDVLAHLTTTTRLSVPLLAREAIRARGSFDRLEVNLAAARAQRHSTAELLQQLRASAESSRRFPGSSPVDPLMDLVIHAQDIARPLHLAYRTPEHVVTACLEHVVGNRFTGAPERVAGLHLVSTDSGWTHGTSSERGDGRRGGSEVRGPGLDLLLAISGRRAGLDALSGPGVDALSERLRPA